MNKKYDKEYLQQMRHSCAHLLAAAVLELWPDTKTTIGPAIENGFYYDFEFSQPISEEDLPKIEMKMAKLLSKWVNFEKREVAPDEAKKVYKNNLYKLELIDEIEKKKESITFYKAGTFEDLCRGGHLENPSKEIGAFKLLSIAGAYWRGSEKNKMLTRIYGTCFSTQQKLEEYLNMLEEEKKRDHRTIGKNQELFLVSQEIGGGLPIFMPKGMILRKIIENYLTTEKKKNGYQFVWTPHIAKKEIYIKSKHWGKYDAMFNPMELDGDEYILKPMNCPHHFQIYLSKPRSYKELPLRIAENATVYRNEKSGELNGLFRVRSATIDDTHTFVRNDSKYVEEELERVINLVRKVISDFGFKSYKARISLRDKSHLEKYIGDQKMWDVAEQALERVAHNYDIPNFTAEGEAAFYGPKIDIMIKDAIGREWQCSTIQLDFQQPLNFNMRFINEDGKENMPAVLHIAMIGSIERFMGILIEHYVGKFPLWLSPVQVLILPIADRHNEYAIKIKQTIEEKGIRVEFDSRSQTLQSKIREATLQKVPYLGIIGDKEILNIKNQISKISIRLRNGQDLGQMEVSQFLQKLKEEIDKKI